MEIRIQSINFEIQTQLKDFIEDKLKKLSTFYDKISEAEVFLKIEKDNKKENKKIDIKLMVPGSSFFSSSNASSFEVAIDDAVEGMRRQLRKFKGKKQP